jgi:beta-lactamase regulating signal transducer with metallopeptidase domain
MNGMVWWLLQNALVATVLAGMVALICRFAKPGPAVRHALWLVVLIKLIAPPIVYWPWTTGSLWQPMSRWLVAEKSCNEGYCPEPRPAKIGADPSPEIQLSDAPIEVFLIHAPPEQEPRVAILEPPSAKEIIEEPSPETPETASNSQPRIWSDSADHLIIQAWLVGAVAMLIWQIANIGRFRQLLADGNQAPSWLQQQVEELAAVLNIQPPEILVVPHIASPMIWSMGRARLVWPAELFDRLSESSRQSVLLHELAHLRRRDHLVGWLQLLGGCLCWWNPLFWYVSRQVRENAELACDAWVVATLPEARRDYAEALIEVAQLMSQVEAPTPALSLGSGRRREFERRLVMIMCSGIPCKLSLGGLVVVGLLALVALPGWSQDQPTPPAKPVAPVAVPPAAPQEASPQAVPVPPVPANANFAPSVAEVQANPYALAPVDQNDPDARLRAIEQQLQALLQEVKGMRNSSPNNKATRTPGVRHVPAQAATPPSPIYAGRIARVPDGQTLQPPAVVAANANPGSEVTLTRATYELPGEKAKALSELMQGYKGPEITFKIEGDKMTVTTTPEAQHVLGQFVRFLQGKPSTPNMYYVPVTSYQAVPTTAPARR